MQMSLNYNPGGCLLDTDGQMCSVHTAKARKANQQLRGKFVSMNRMTASLLHRRRRSRWDLQSRQSVCIFTPHGPANLLALGSLLSSDSRPNSESRDLSWLNDGQQTSGPVDGARASGPAPTAKRGGRMSRLMFELLHIAYDFGSLRAIVLFIQ